MTPYRLSDDGLCVHKKNADGSMGETVPGGCHKTKADAKAHMDAMNIAMSKEKAMDLGTADSSMVALFLPLEIGNYIYSVVKDRFAGMADDPSFTLIEPQDYHVTLCYLGSGIDSTTADNARTTLQMKQATSGPYYGWIGGAGYFNNDPFAIYLSVDSPEITYFRQTLIDALSELNIWPWDNHGFTPHITVAYSDAPLSALPIFPRLSLSFNSVTLANGSDREDFAFGMMKSVGEIQAQVLEKAAYFDPQGNLVLKVVGVPFTGPVNGKADLVGEWFDEKSQITLSADAIESDFDHGRDDQWLPNELKGQGFGTKAIGLAMMEDEIYQDDEKGIKGRLFKVIVDRHHKYLDVLKKLADRGMLGGSMKMLSRENGKQKGYIAKAEIGKMSITPTPMNPDAISLYKSVLLEAFTGDKEDMAKTKEEAKEPEKKVEDKAAPPAQNGSGEKSLVDQIDEIFDGSKSSETPASENPFEKSVLDLLGKIDARLTALETAKPSETMEKSLAELSEDVQEIREAFPKLATRVIETLSGKVTKQLEKSVDQREAEDNVRKAHSNGKLVGVIPSSAPGKK